MLLVIRSSGEVHCLYDEKIDLAQLGPTSIRRGSFVEPDAMGQWHADLAPVNGPVLGPFCNRSQALTAEAAWLVEHWLMPEERETHSEVMASTALAPIPILTTKSLKGSP